MTDARSAVAATRRAATPPAAGSPGGWTVVRLAGLAAAGLALGLLALLHLLVARISPVSDTISDYALSREGWIFDAAALVLAGGSVPLLGPLLRRRGIGVPVIGACFACWCLGLVVLTAFPRDPVGMPVSPTGEVHRWAAVATLLGLPLGALLTALRHRGAGARAVTIVAGACLVALGPFVVAYLAGSPLRPYVGLIERVVAVGEVGLLFLLGTVSLGVHASAVAARDRAITG